MAEGIPSVGEQVQIGNLIMTVETMVERRVDRVRLQLEDASTRGRAG